MKKSTGRPPLGQATKSNAVMVRFSTSQFDIIDAKASRVGNSFEIHLEGGSINITINEEGGRK